MSRLSILLLITALLCAATLPAPATSGARHAEPSAAQFDARPALLAWHSAALLAPYRADLNRAAAWNQYAFNLAIDPVERTLSGTQTLYYTNRDTTALPDLYFRLFPNLPDLGGSLEIQSVRVNGTETAFRYQSSRYLARIPLPQPLQPGQQVVVTLTFTTRTPEGAAQLYGAFNKQGGVMALASAYPIIAMVSNGQWDIALPDTRGDLVNSETALYSAQISLPNEWTLVTTGVTLLQRQSGPNRIAQVVSGPQRDFFIAAHRLPVLSASINGTRINAYYRSGAENGGREALRAALNAIRIFNARFGSYPLAELDVIPVDAGTFLGVEYPGVILMEQRLYTERPGLEIVLAHEVAHQWWYSLVGNNVQTEAWLDEGLASYAQVLYREDLQGPEAAQAELDIFRERYRDVRAAGRDGPVAQDNTGFRGSYYTLVYAKAALFHQALRNRIGDAAYNQFLRDYYRSHRYGFVSGQDLLAAAERACTCELDTLYRDWILTTAPVEIP